MWSNQENRVRKQVKNPCEARKIKASQILHKIISTHPLMMEDGHCSLSNNLSKNAIRPFTVTVGTACLMERDCENELSKLK